MRGKHFTKIYRWHRILGLCLLIPLLVLTVSGSILVFRQDALEESKAAPIESDAPFYPLQHFVDKAKASMPGETALALTLSEEDPRSLNVRMGQNGSTLFKGSKRFYYDRQSGELQTPIEDSGFWAWLLRLHRDFLLGFYGKLFVGFIGIAFLGLLITGLIVYGPTMKNLFFGAIRWQGPRAWTWSDFHKLLGASLLGWCLLMAASGTLLALSGQILKLYQYAELNALQTRYADTNVPENPVSLDAAYATAQKALPQHEASLITFPGGEFATAPHYIFVMHGLDAWNHHRPQLVLVNAADGSLAEVLALPWYLQAALISEPLHFGDYGTWVMKILWASAGVWTAVLALSGGLLYFRRRVPKKEAARKAKILTKPQSRAPIYRTPLLLAGAFLVPSFLALFTHGFWDLAPELILMLPLIVLFQKIIAALKEGRAVSKVRS